MDVFQDPLLEAGGKPREDMILIPGAPPAGDKHHMCSHRLRQKREREDRDHGGGGGVREMIVGRMLFHVVGSHHLNAA